MIEHYLSKWKNWRLSDIGPDDVARLHDSLARAGVGATGHLAEPKRLGSEPVNVRGFLTFESMTCDGRWGAGYQVKDTTFN